METKQIKLQSILLLVEANNEFKKSAESFKVSAVLGIKLGLLTREISSIVEDFNKTRNELIKKYGEAVIQDGKEVEKVKDDKVDDFFKELKDVTESEYTIVNLIDIKYFENIDLPLYLSDSLADFTK